MRRRWICLVRSLVVAAALLAPAVAWVAPARAQVLERPDPRQGYYLSVGPRLAVNKVWMDNQHYGIWPGGEVGLHFGQMITRRFGLGLQVHVGAARGDGQKAATFGLELEAQWEIMRRLAIHGGAGLDTLEVMDQAGTDKTLRGAAGSGYFLGLSYSWFFTHRLTGGWAVTPRIDARFVPGTTTSALAGLIGLEIAWWTGLPRNQLELPSSEAYKKKK